MTISRVQTFAVATKSDGAGSTVSNVLGLIPVAGNLLVACLSSGDAGGAITVSTFDDNIGDGVPWTASTLNPQGMLAGGNTQYRIYYKVVGTPSGGAKTVQCTIAGTQALALFVGEYGLVSGLPSWSVDGSQIAANGTVVFPADAGDITVSGSDTVLVGFSGCGGALWNAGAGFTRQATSTVWAADGVEDRLVSASGTYAVDWTDGGGSDSWIAMGIAFRADTGGGGPTVSSVTATSPTEAGNIVFTATMSGTGGGVFAYSWGGTATGADYTQALTTGMCSVTAGSGTVTVSGSNVTVPSTATAFTITVPTTTDTLDENNETVILTLGGTASSTSTITDDDALPSLSVNDVTQIGGTVTFTVTLTPVSGRSVTVDYATANGAKTAGVDYTANSGTLTFAPGETSKTVAVTVL